MPTYNYSCPECGRSLERHLYPVEYRNDLPTCITCGVKMKLIINPPSIRFEGDGWQTRKPVKEGEK